MNPRKLEHGLRMISARIPFYLKGMRIMMFQLSSFCHSLGAGLKIWEFPKIGDPNIVP